MLAVVVVVAAVGAAGPAAAPAAAPAESAKRRVLVLDMKSEGAPPEAARLMRDAVAAQLAKQPSLDVVTTEDMRTLVDVEAQKQSLGCDDTSCMAEVAGALGAELVVFGNVGALGSLFAVNLSLFDSKQARSIGRISAEARSLEDLPAITRDTVDKLVAPLVGGASSSASGSGSALLWTGAVLGGLGVAGAAVGAVGAGVAAGIVSDGREPPVGPKPEDRVVTRTTGQALVGVAAVGVALAATGATMVALGWGE